MIPNDGSDYSDESDEANDYNDANGCIDWDDDNAIRNA